MNQNEKELAAQVGEKTLGQIAFESWLAPEDWNYPDRCDWKRAPQQSWNRAASAVASAAVAAHEAEQQADLTDVVKNFDHAIGVLNVEIAALRGENERLRAALELIEFYYVGWNPEESLLPADWPRDDKGDEMSPAKIVEVALASPAKEEPEKRLLLDRRDFHEAIAIRLDRNFLIQKRFGVEYANEDMLSMVANVIGNEINHFCHSKQEAPPHAQEPEKCAMCDDDGIVGAPPDKDGSLQGQDCPDCHGTGLAQPEGKK